MESIPEEYILACPHHGMDEWLVLQSFYNGLTITSRAHLDAAAGGAFLEDHQGYGLDREYGLQSGLEQGAFPAQKQGYAYHQGGGYARHKNGPPTEETRRREQTTVVCSRPCHELALSVRSMW